MGLESRDWYWKERKRRAERFNPADPAGDLQGGAHRKLTKQRWQAFKKQEEQLASESHPKWCWNNKKDDIVLNETDFPRLKAERRPAPQPKPRVRKQAREVHILRVLLVGSVIINFMAFKALYDLANP